MDCSTSLPLRRFVDRSDFKMFVRQKKTFSPIYWLECKHFRRRIGFSGAFGIVNQLSNNQPARLGTDCWNFDDNSVRVPVMTRTCHPVFAELGIFRFSSLIPHKASEDNRSSNDAWRYRPLPFPPSQSEVELLEHNLL